MASLSVSGLEPISAAVAGSEVAITVESMFSMNRAVATISGIMRCLFIDTIRDDGTTERDSESWHGERVRASDSWGQLIFSFSSFAGDVNRRLSGHVCGGFVQKP